MNDEAQPTTCGVETVPDATGDSTDSAYETFVPFILSCPICGQVHQTSKDMAKCSVHQLQVEAKAHDIDAYADFVVDMWFSKAVDGEPHFEANPDFRSMFIMTAGLGGELGEVLEHVKKYVRDATLDRENLKKELGDVQYYLVRLMRYFGFQPSEVLAANVEKLESRHQRGVLQGSGDNR